MARTYDELQAAIWTDERNMPPGTRELALAIAWVHHAEPGNDHRVWARVRELAGWTGYSWRVHELVEGDAPRYHPPSGAYGSACEGPRMRPYRPRRPAYLDRCLVSDHHPHVGDCRYPVIHGGGRDEPERDDSVCGSYATISVKERDMVAGWVTEHWFCTRHKGRAAEVRRQIAARGEPPEPVPNHGGLLPRYFGGDWAAIYAKHCEERCRHWKVPYYGVDADDWPVPGKTLIPKRPRLSVVQSAC